MKRCLSMILCLLMVCSAVSLFAPAVNAASGYNVNLTYHPTSGNKLNFTLPSNSPFYIPEDDGGYEDCEWEKSGNGTWYVNNNIYPEIGRYITFILKLRCKDENSSPRGFAHNVTFNGIALEDAGGISSGRNLDVNQFSIYDDSGVLILKVRFFCVTMKVLPAYTSGVDAFAVTEFDTEAAWYMIGETAKVYTREEQGCHNTGWMSSPPTTFTKLNDGGFSFTTMGYNTECNAVMAENTVNASFTLPKEGDPVTDPNLVITGNAVINTNRTDPQCWVDVTDGGRPDAAGRFTAGRKYIAIFCVIGKGSKNIDEDTKFVINGKNYYPDKIKISGTDYYFIDVPYEPTEHNYDAGKVTTAATCDKAGVKTYTCPCGATKTEPIAATGNHSFGDWAVTTAPTCVKQGTETRTCSVCKKTETRSVAATGKHDYRIADDEQDIWAATLDDDGYIKYTCTVCGKTKTEVIPMVSGVTLSKTTFTANGKVQKPTVTVKDRNGNDPDGFISVSYSNEKSKAAGTYKVYLRAGDWEDQRVGWKYYFSQTYTYTIKPAKTKELKVTEVGTKTLKLGWKAVTGAKYYSVYISKDGKSWTHKATVSTNSATIKDLKAGTKYQVKVRALDSKKKVKGAFSDVLKTQTKTAAPKISKLTSSKSKTATVTWGKVTGASKYIVYKSTDGKTFKKVATTSKLTYTLTKLTGGKKIYVKIVALNAYSTKSAASAVKYVTVKK